jgi:D-alanyl-lipoteichoic acid acyltransferase DltB (MBOAT superfamily)
VYVVCDVEKRNWMFQNKKGTHASFFLQQDSATADISNISVHCVISGFWHGMNETFVVLGQCTALNSSKCCALN